MAKVLCTKIFKEIETALFEIFTIKDFNGSFVVLN